MLFLYFNGIRTEQGEYVVEISQTAESERRIMNVSSAFFMKIPAELLNAPLDTLRNTRLREKFDAHPDTRFVKSLRNHFGQKMISGEVVKLETNLSVMTERNILIRSSVVDKDGVERLVSTGASYETISMTCPLTSQLVGFATKLGEPAMIFMTSQDTFAKRPEDAENDSILALFNEARAKVYDIELLLNPDVVAMNNTQIQQVVSSIQTLTQNSIAAELEEKNVAINLSNWTAEFSSYKLSEELDIEEAADTQVKHAESLVAERQRTLREAEETESRINRIVETITTSWQEIQERKEDAHYEKQTAISNLLKEGSEAKAQDVVSGHLPISQDLSQLIESKNELEDEIKIMSDTANPPVSAYQNIAQSAPLSTSIKNSLPAQTTSTRTEAKPVKPDGITDSSELGDNTTQISEQGNINNINSVVTNVIEQKIEQITEDSTQQISEMKIETYTEITPVVEPLPTEAKLETQPQTTETIEVKLETQPQPSETKTETPVETTPEVAQISNPTLSERLQKLYDRAEKALTEVVSINSKIEEIKKDSEKKIKDISLIADAVRSARLVRNKTIVNWPAAKELINKSKAGFSYGYTQWNWYYTNFPHLVVNYILELLIEKGRWGDVKFTTLEDKSIPTHIIPNDKSKQDGINTYKHLLQRLSKKNYLPENVLYLLQRFIFGEPNTMDQLHPLLNPNPRRSFRSTDVGQFELKLGENQLKKILKSVEETTEQTDVTRQKLHAARDQIAQLSEQSTPDAPEAEEKKIARITLQREATLLGVRLKKFEAAKKKAWNTYVTGQQWIASKTPRISHANTIWADQQNENTSAEVSNSVSNTPITSEKTKSEADHKLEMDLRSAVMLGKKDKFNELYAKADSEVIKKLESYCKSKPRLLAKLNEFKSATDATHNNTRLTMSKR